MNKYLIKFNSNKKMFQTRIIEADCGNSAISKLRVLIKQEDPKEIIAELSIIQIN